MSWILQKIEFLMVFTTRFLTPRRILLLSFVFAILWLIIFLLFNLTIYRDVAGCYAWYGREFGRGHWNTAPIAALPPLNIFLCGVLVKCGFEAYRALMFISGTFFILTILPLYGVLRNFLSPRLAAYGCLLLVMTPKIILFSNLGLLESTRDFFLVSAMYFLFAIWRHRCFFLPAEAKEKRLNLFWHHVALGISLGLLSLSRGEGCVMAGLIFLAMFVLPRLGYKKWWKQILAGLAITAVTVSIIVSPRLVETWRFTGYPVIDTRCIGLIKKLPLINQLFQDKRQHEVITADPAWNVASTTKKNNFPRLPGQILRGGYEFYMLLALLGIVWLIRLKQFDVWHGFLLFFSAVVSIVIGFYSVAYRYFVFLVPVLMVFTLHGVIFLFEMTKKYKLQELFLLIFGVIIIGQTYNAWGRLFSQLEAYREIKMAQFLKVNKHRFLPENEKKRKLIIADYRLPEITYRADEARFFQYNQEYGSPMRIHGFDVFIIPRDEEKLLKLISARKDLREIQHSMSEYYSLFAFVSNDENK